MGDKLLILGESGSGKSSSTKTLNPETTFYINVIGKPLPYKGWKGKYARVEGDKGNMLVTHDAEKVQACIKWVSANKPDIKTIIVDDAQYIMSYEFMERAKERGLNYTSPCMEVV